MAKKTKANLEFLLVELGGDRPRESLVKRPFER